MTWQKKRVWDKVNAFLSSLGKNANEHSTKHDLVFIDEKAGNPVPTKRPKL